MINEIDLKKAMKGDENSIKSVLFDIAPFVLSLCRKWCRPPLEPGDVAQESLITLVKNLGSFKGDSAFKTWVYSVSYRTFLDAYRKQNRRDEIAKFSPISEINEVDTNVIAISEPDETNVIIEALGELDPKYSQVLFMFCVDECTYEEIASELGIPVGTVRSRLARARIKLRDLLNENGTFRASKDVKNVRQEK